MKLTSNVHKRSVVWNGKRIVGEKFMFMYQKRNNSCKINRLVKNYGIGCLNIRLFVNWSLNSWRTWRIFYFFQGHGRFYLISSYLYTGILLVFICRVLGLTWLGWFSDCSRHRIFKIINREISATRQKITLAKLRIEIGPRCVNRLNHSTSSQA